MLKVAPSRSARALLALWLIASIVGAARAADTLDFGVREGLNLNRFLRSGPVAGHLLLRSGSDARILVAFPAGNSGVGLWFTHTEEKVSWMLEAPPRAVHDVDASGRALYGLVADASCEAHELKVGQAVLSSIRTLRDFELLHTLPANLAATATIKGRVLTWTRDRIDGAAGYRLVVEVTHGEVRDGQLLAAADGRVGLRITGLTGETPLTPLSGAELMNGPARVGAAADTLTFLAYREKFLAGSWRFDTYFGRDTLMSVRLLMPVLSPTAVESGLSSVLARLSPDGEVAHEEDIGERAVLDHLEKDGSRSAAPVYDYKMIDGDFLLAPVASAWLVHDGRARDRAAVFLAAPAGPSDGRRGAALVANLRHVLKRAAPFAQEPTTRHLVPLRAGFNVGDWRDSETGLGGGRYPYDVNAVLVPAALEAVVDLYGSGLLAPYLTADDRALFGRAANMAQVWRAKAPPLFEITLSRQAAARDIERYAAALAVDSQRALAALGSQELRFHAIALDASGAAVPIMHSDEGFALLFETLDAERLDRAVSALMRPFPAGLMTDAGMLVANAAFAPAALQRHFTRNAYHGAVVWSWQQALFAAGLERQLRRTDLPPLVRKHVLESQRVLWRAIGATRAMNNSELWSWSFAAGHYHVAPFGTAAADADESNAAQLWSTVYLAVKPPVTGVTAK